MGGHHRGEASPGVAGSARYDSEIILYMFSVVSLAWADPVGCFYVEAEDQAAQGRATLDRLSRPLEALLGAFEPEGVAAAESLSERLEAPHGRLEAFVKGAARDAV